eukprot:TRINITY_DN4807_c0_g1_i2.p1 TRINITY_DN4807_c0_g1~~TRINITY_DN4807_c0_g1_i2.p1  ORF type:complete len:318 (-),score=61.89 TRINITY_DN4807_c0_g1_i2:77-1030(-)
MSHEEHHHDIEMEHKINLVNATDVVQPPPKERERGQRKPYHHKSFKTPKEVMTAIIISGTNKMNLPLAKLVVLGILSGVYIAFGGIASITASAGSPTLRGSDPGIPRLINAAIFPIALILIIIASGELFTGNVSQCVVAYLHQKRMKDPAASAAKLAINLFVVYFTNFAGAAGAAYFFGYLTELFSADPYLTNVQSLAVSKTSFGFGVMFLRAIAANQLVNLAIVMCIASEDIVSKIVAAWFPIMTFALSSFEHCVANMFIVCLSLMYGSKATFGEFIAYNLVPVTLGNIVGGLGFVGLAYYYVYVWDVPNVPTKSN